MNFQLIWDLTNCSRIATTVAIVRCWKYGAHCVLIDRSVTLHNHLMSTHYWLQVVGVQELLKDIRSKYLANTPLVIPESLKFQFIWIVPQQFTHLTLTRYFTNPIQCPNLCMCNAITSSSPLTSYAIPPCTHQILSSIVADSGIKSKDSLMYRHALREPYFLMHSS